ncbi:hypothetical protein RHMOL_Rhmol01G0277900 [Rhododendron molle]|uniref:Uncharacterized protein n=1 Tax=Rhododendron molle TaxID=49168 RepID=A0ACC0Q5X6_RHOML|nr:hypothetical protein RHMOL_Rhmol01G0277900 [Rhododendron molle]
MFFCTSRLAGSFTGRSPRSGLYWSRLLDPVGVGGGIIIFRLGFVVGLSFQLQCSPLLAWVWVVSAVLVRIWVAVEVFGVRGRCPVQWAVCPWCVRLQLLDPTKEACRSLEAMNSDRGAVFFLWLFLSCCFSLDFCCAYCFLRV